jgi:rSAM/selenodomain-associated transferase 1
MRSRSDPTKAALIILARHPKVGAIRSRLAATLGEEVATNFHRLCAERLFLELERLSFPVQRFLFYAGEDQEAALRNWTGDRFVFELQEGTDRGERLCHAFSTTFSQRVHKAVIVGTDIPDLTAGLIDEALHLLDVYDVVIGPDHNGGYYLLGMKALHEELFYNVPWGTSRLYGATLRKIKALGLSLAFLPVLIDVNTEADLRRWMEGDRRSRRGQLEDYLRATLAL